jgi:hypothetical protein
MSIISALGRLRQENHVFKSSLGNSVSIKQKKKKKKKMCNITSD